MKIAIPFLKYIFTLIFVLGIILVIGGVYLGILNYSSQTTFEIWGITLKTFSVGIAAMFGGIILIILSLRKTLKAFESMSKLGDKR